MTEFVDEDPMLLAAESSNEFWSKFNTAVDGTKNYYERFLSKDATSVVVIDPDTTAEQVVASLKMKLTSIQNC